MPKLNGGSNYKAQLTVIKFILRFYLLWDIVSGVKVLFLGFDITSNKTLKTSGKEKSGFSNTSTNTALSLSQSQLKKNAKASFFILCMIEFVFFDNITSNIFKQLWDYPKSQYKKKNFILWHNLFIYLITTKLNKYFSVKEYQLNFKLTLQKLYKSGAFLPKNLQLTAFFHRIEEIYSEQVFVKCSTI